MGGDVLARLFLDRLSSTHRSNCLQHESQAEGGMAVRHDVWSVVATMLALVVVGCGGPGQTIPLSVNIGAVPAPEKMTAPLRVAVIQFEDVRSDKAKVGRYQHYVESTVDTLV